MRQWTSIGLAVVAALSPACKSRHLNEGAQVARRKALFEAGSTVTSANRTTYLFHWTSDKGAALNPKQYISTQIAYAKQRNPTFVYPGDMAGHGLYLASDPLSTREYGDTLLVVPVKAGQRYKAIDQFDDQDKSIIVIRDSSVKGIVYPYKVFLSFENGERQGYAAVLRDESLVEESVPIRTLRSQARNASKFEMSASQDWFKLLEANANSYLESMRRPLSTYASVSYKGKEYARIKSVRAHARVMNLELLGSVHKVLDISKYAICVNNGAEDSTDCFDSILTTDDVFEREDEKPSALAFLADVGVVESSRMPRDDAELAVVLLRHLEKTAPQAVRAEENTREFVTRVCDGVAKEGSMLEWK